MTTPQNPDATNQPTPSIPDNTQPNVAPPATQPQQPQPRPVVVNTPAHDGQLLNAINALPEQLANTFKEIFPANPRTDTTPASTGQTTQQPPTTTAPATAAATPEKWNLGRWWFTGNGRSKS